ncbi:MAG TPA: hypothetical protein VGW40_05735 [Allosphingosinicella sp.]|nr:hypothetical protein [Allosphingosinicella sp.]
MESGLAASDFTAIRTTVEIDADGSGAGGQMLFATLQAGTALTASDFTVI